MKSQCCPTEQLALVTTGCVLIADPPPCLEDCVPLLAGSSCGAPVRCCPAQPNSAGCLQERRLIPPPHTQPLITHANIPSDYK